MEKKKGNTGRGGGQYGNKNAEKWTKKDALEFGEELIYWLMPNIEEKKVFSKSKGELIGTGEFKDKHASNIWFKKFMQVKGVFEKETIYLAKKFKSFSTLIKKAKDIQERKLWEWAAANQINTSIAIFGLKVLHGHKETQVMEHSGVTLQVSPDFMPKEAKGK